MSRVPSELPAWGQLDCSGSWKALRTLFSIDSEFKEQRWERVARKSFLIGNNTRFVSYLALYTRKCPSATNCSLYYTNLEWKHFCKIVPFKRVKSVLVSNGVEKIQYCMFLYVLIVVDGLGGLSETSRVLHQNCSGIFGQ